MRAGGAHRHLGKSIAKFAMLQALDRIKQRLAKRHRSLRIMLQQVICHAPGSPHPYAW